MARVIGERFELLAELARGPLGYVCRSRHTMLDTTCRLWLLPEALAGDATRIERLQRGARSVLLDPADRDCHGGQNPRSPLGRVPRRVG